MKREEFEKKYLNQIVSVELFYGGIYTGKLELCDASWGTWKDKGYHIKNMGFRKTHIKKINGVKL